ncbi:MAG TPA: phosphoenolpyruvate--protein phosphotransferase [Terriglobales bacterium]|nr:phosphoenolpyruvate--protein phosphotransferase [Terriglobales bacterium]
MASKASAGLELRFTCRLQAGVHARPASALAEFAARFSSECVITNLRTGAQANAKSVLSIIGADIRDGDECSVRITGLDEAEFQAALRRFVDHDLGQRERAALPSSEPKTKVGGRLPRALRDAGVVCYAGIPVSGGIAQGAVMVAGGIALPRGPGPAGPTDAKRELAKFEHALQAARARIRQMLARESAPAASGILRAHLALVNDVSLTESVSQRIASGASAGQAIADAGEFFAGMLSRSESAYVRERAIDVQEVCQQLLADILGPDFHAAAMELGPASVVVSRALAPQQLLALDRGRLAALVLEAEGATSHTAILARSLGIPAIVRVKGASQVLKAGQQVIVDANRGIVVPERTPAVERFYEREISVLARRKAVLERSAAAPAVTTDGVRIEVAANITSAAEAVAAFQAGADSVGVFRTEMLFVGRDELPGEEEQFAAYAAAARAGAGRPVIIRTLDIGGDKPVPSLNLPPEANPFLGFRGVRIYPEHEALIRRQVRALLRASAVGRVQMMAPMVSSAAEVRWMKALVADVQKQLQDEGVAYDPAMPAGIMLEVPAAAFLLDELGREADFFSLGTNDLAQYFFAADRGNAKVSGIASVQQPAFLRFLQQIADGVKRHGKWMGVCGEMAADPANLPLLVGLGLDEISAPASEIPLLKERVHQLSAADCKSVLARAIACADAEQVSELLAQVSAGDQRRPLLGQELVILNSEATSKEEVIRELVRALYVAGRTDEPDALEDALWAREATYSTGLGHGFAIPHCKTNSVRSGSMCVLKLSQPVNWGTTVDDAPVSVVILLALREADANRRHMQVFSQLARRLMSEEFRNGLAGLAEAGAVAAFLNQQLQVEVS